MRHRNYDWQLDYYAVLQAVQVLERQWRLLASVAAVLVGDISIPHSADRSTPPWLSVIAADNRPHVGAHIREKYLPFIYRHGAR